MLEKRGPIDLERGIDRVRFRLVKEVENKIQKEIELNRSSERGYIEKK